MRAHSTFPQLAHACLYPKESTPQQSVRRLKSNRAVQSTPAQSSPVKKQNFEMASTQEISNAVASIIPVVDQEKAASSSARDRSLSPELFQADRRTGGQSRPVVKDKVASSSGKGRSLSLDLFEAEDRPAARSGPIGKYRVACNKTSPYAGSWTTARKSLRPSTPPAAAVVEQPRAPSPEEPPVVLTPSEEAPVVLTPLAVPLSPMLATPANLGVLVPQVPVREPIGEVSEEMESYLQRCREIDLASRAILAKLASNSRRRAEIAS
ncbi:uncharacterized protein [Leptinotarsa decemlineata]|uniref:uncharacterized protein n=1 Tax=Leptinotarsa decemlineata TaxID=7539 RepID=UPI003D30C9C4